MNRTLPNLTIIAAGALACAAHADVYTGSGGSVADNTPQGSAFTINVNDSLVLSDLSVTLTNFRHSNIGDLSATLTHVPSGLSISLFDRIGRTTTASNNKGDNSDFYYDYTFADGGSNIWAAAKDAGSGAKIAGGTYAATGSGIGSSTSTGPASLSFASTFAGIDAHGEWVLNVSDNAKNSSLNSDWCWSLNIASVPTPGALALMAAAGAVGRRRRQR